MCNYQKIRHTIIMMKGPVSIMYDTKCKIMTPYGASLLACKKAHKFWPLRFIKMHNKF